MLGNVTNFYVISTTPVDTAKESLIGGAESAPPSRNRVKVTYTKYETLR